MLKRVLILCLAAFIFSGCSDKSCREEITFSSWGSVTEVKILNKIIDDFETENPDIKINFIHIPQNYFQKLHLLFASNQAPDVIFLNNLYLPVYAEKLEPFEFDEKDFFSKSVEALSYENKRLALPRDISNLVFYRNKSLVKTTPKNLDELMSTISNVKPYGISFERDMYFMFPYVLTFGEDIYHPQKSLEFYKNLEGKYAPNPSDVGSSTLAQMFLEGKIGLYLSGRWMYPKIKETANFEWDVIPFCGTVPLDASGWGISKSSKHKKSAKKFVEYLGSKTSSEYFTSTGLIIPARVDVKIDEHAFFEALANSKVLKIDKNYRKIIDKMNKELLN